MNQIQCAIALLLVSLTASGEANETPVSLVKSKASGEGVTVSGGQSGEELTATIEAGAKGTAGVIFHPGNSTWDFSEHNRIEAVVSNTGDFPLPVSLRVDNKGHWKDAPWNTETIRLNPGDSKAIVVFFGYHHGWKPGFELQPSEITQLLFFTGGAEESRSFTIHSVVARGSKEESPDDWKQRPGKVSGGDLLYSAKNGLQSARQLSAGNRARIVADPGGLKLTFPEEKSSVTFQPLTGYRDLRQSNQVEITIFNDGTVPIQAQGAIGSKSGATAPASLTEPVLPGQSAILTVPFASPEPWIATDSQSGEKKSFASNRTNAVTLSPVGHQFPVSLRVTRIEASAPPLVLPDWSGKRPPVEGDWELTLNEDFDVSDLNENLWNVYTTNHWDKRSHFSKENVLLENDAALLRYEKKEGHHNDDPEEKTTPYATGFLDTFGKWKQRYGYFECRVKLPTAPGLWPAFWMMPDRGPADAPRWKREQTTNGGMEFDIMEYLSGWGPYRYNLAFHWDGYGKNHKSAGTSGIYFQHDEQGYVTTGMLWLPGEVTYYCNGKAVGLWKSERISAIESIIMFTHVSGGWDNEAIDDTQLPSDFEIDYVRAWQRSDLK